MKEFRGTKGEHKPVFVSGVCIGIGVELEPNYNQMIINTILPDTDKEYSKQKEEIEANVKLYCAAPELLASLKQCLEAVHELNDEFQEGWDEVIERAEQAINKALGI